MLTFKEYWRFVFEFSESEKVIVQRISKIIKIDIDTLLLFPDIKNKFKQITVFHIYIYVLPIRIGLCLLITVKLIYFNQNIRKKCFKSKIVILILILILDTWYYIYLFKNMLGPSIILIYLLIINLLWLYKEIKFF